MFLKRLVSKKYIQSSINVFIRTYQVTVMGGASEVGQIVNLMLRSEPLITNLMIHDIRAGAQGVVQDLSHIPNNSTVVGYYGLDSLDRALRNSDIVLVTGGAIITPGMTYKELFETNSAFVRSVAAQVGKLPRMPFVGIVMDPINVLVPMAAEIIRNNGAYNPYKMFGITTVDWLRAQTLFADMHQLRPEDCLVPVLGGHSEQTIVPLLSHSCPPHRMGREDIVKFTTKLKNCGNIVTETKQGLPATMSVAYGVLLFTRAIMSALEGIDSPLCAYVENNSFGTSYFAGLVTVNKNGIKDMQRYTNLSQYECDLLELAIKHVREDVTLGIKTLETA